MTARKVRKNFFARDNRTSAVFRPQQADGLQDRERLAQRSPADVEALCQLALWRQQLTFAKLSAADHFLDPPCGRVWNSGQRHIHFRRLILSLWSGQMTWSNHANNVSDISSIPFSRKFQRLTSPSAISVAST